ncbi:MAG TPA: response regulator transcription factor [Geobacterales bacterium]|nr:response regulator transcription factor [Geobacterales bacterium]
MVAVAQKIDHPPHILLVEDEPHLARGIRFNLEQEGYQVSVASRGEAALEMLEMERFNLVILDVMLPGINGFTVCRELRKSDGRVPVLMLTARADEGDRVTGLMSGADDYLTKPFNLQEFLLRVRGLLRRSAWSTQTESHRPVTFGDNEVDLTSYRGHTRQGDIVLTELEVKMLTLFFERPGEVLSRRELLETVWGYSAETETRTLDNFIVRLRKYFEPDPAKPIHFQTVRGVGYRFSRDGT